MSTPKVQASDRMEGMAPGLGVAAGIMAAQSVFLVRHLRPQNGSGGNAQAGF
jgi:negative regulator of sigma E activity